MTIEANRFQKLLSEFRLEQLFNELGWERPHLNPQAITVNNATFTLVNLAHKRGVSVFRCSPDNDGNIPARPMLLKIEKEVVKLSHEHLLVFSDAKESTLTWMWVSRVPGQPTTTRTHTWHRGQSGESLRQKLSQIIWSLQEEEAITLTDVITGLKQAFDRDRISKSFYDRFKAEHEVFAEFIEGLSATSDQAWYASLMLNRLMFVYFIQKKGFLDSDEDYLANRMARVQVSAGKGKFHSFYRQFLRRLFHEGLGRAKGERNPELASLIGDVPYLNGGLFSLHQLEEANPGIDVPDEAFERLFNFFDAWDWHLDDRPLASGREINPDVLGYIFEKYINQKQMGAYYTKEDITEYISKNTVVPHLLEQTRKLCKVAFDSEFSVWNLIKDDPERYIYLAMKTGVIDADGNVVPESALPDYVQLGMKDAKARMFDKRYNLGEAVFQTSTGERGTLPNETWRDYVQRRNHCLYLQKKLAKGEVKSTDDLVTLNLDIRQFMQDIIDAASSPDLLRSIWHSIVGQVPEKSDGNFRHGISILDPSCGSGAFLFAALSVLEPLYEACLERMEGFVEDAKKLGKTGETDFINVLAEVDKHPSRRYYIFKNIILHNLFGVDIMAEAVEICKLRLFLKLVSQVDAGRELEPLPDIDFNIRAGNSLVGYATEAQFDAANTLASDQMHRQEIKVSTADLAGLFSRFREQQTVHGGKVTSNDKHKLRDKLNGLSLELDRYLACDYGIDPNNENAFTAWRTSHQPFHWFAEFYGVIHEGGFDVVIGNPPYIETSKVTTYSVVPMRTTATNNLYAMLCERAVQLGSSDGLVGMIVPNSSVSAEKMATLQSELTVNRCTWISNYSWRPSKLFEGANMLLAIWITKRALSSKCLSTRYHRWSGEERNNLFQLIQYTDCTKWITPFRIPKIPNDLALAIIEKCKEKSGAHSVLSATTRTGESLFYFRAVLYWFKVLRSPPISEEDGVQTNTSEMKELKFGSIAERNSALAYLASGLFSLYYTMWSSCQVVNSPDLSFPIKLTELGSAAHELSTLADRLMNHVQQESIIQTRQYSSRGRAFTMRKQYFYFKKSKSVIDEIDVILGKHFGFSDDETDFVINYDIKYRMSGADEAE